MSYIPIKAKPILNLLGKTEELFNDNVKSLELKNHCLMVSSILRKMAKEIVPEDEEKWATTGLLYAIDHEEFDDRAKWGRVATERLKKLGYHDNMLHAILSVNEKYTKIVKETELDYALNLAIKATEILYKLKSQGVKVSKNIIRSHLSDGEIRNVERLMGVDEFFGIVVNSSQITLS